MSARESGHQRTTKKNRIVHLSWSSLSGLKFLQRSANKTGALIGLNSISPFTLLFAVGIYSRLLFQSTRHILANQRLFFTLRGRF
jgi:hypothetical protein